jgi:peptide deformylase
MEGSSSERLAELGRRPVGFHALINPAITVVDDARFCFFEGCLCLPEYRGVVPRAAEVRVEALDDRGQPVTIQWRGWPARVLQHEIDHLRGVLYCDVMLPGSFVAVEHYLAHWRDKSGAEIGEAFGSTAGV